jgi:hypothetical protein
MSPRWTLAIAGVLTVLAAAAALYWHGRHDGAARERPKTEAARTEAAVAKLETQGALESAQRVEVVVRQREAAAETVSKLIPEALTSEDAHAPLDPARAARLRDADRSLCRTDPELASCPADRDPG